jgi:hypothetical protein
MVTAATFHIGAATLAKRRKVTRLLVRNPQEFDRPCYLPQMTETAAPTVHNSRPHPE